ILFNLLNSGTVRAQPGTLDPTFTGNVSGGTIYKIALLSDGRMLIAGTFSTVDGTSQQGIARLQPNGGRDPSFFATVSYGINDFAIDASNRIVLGGEFTRVNSAPMTNLARILPDGGTDTSFLTTANRIVDTVALQADGKILVGGAFSQISYGFAGMPRNRITRLNPDSSDDGSFASTNRGGDSSVFAFAIQPDGKVLVGGGFHTFDGQSRPYLVRLNSDMSLDPAYVPDIDGPIYGLTLTPDGKTLVWGGFQRVNGIERPMLARLNEDGSLDTTFDADIRLYGGNVYTAVFDSAGRLYIAGSFTSVRGTPRDGFARLHSNGDLDTGFYPPSTIDGYINAIAVLPNDELIIGGNFTGYGGLFTPRVARVHGGFAPPAAPVIVRQSTNATIRAGDDTAFVVEATGGPRLYYQWQFYGTNLIGETRGTLELNDVLPVNGGTYSVIVSNEVGTVTSEPIVLTVSAAAPVFTVQPTNKVAFLGQTVRFTGNATGAPNPTLQWQLRGTNIPAAGGSILILSNVNYSHAGDYRLLASNAVGVSTSAVAQLTVNPPKTNAGAVDLGFVPLPGFVSQASSVSAAAAQPDGRLIVAGTGRIRRLLADGSLDSTFDTNASVNGTIYSIALQSDGKVVLGGYFAQVNGVNRYQIARLHEDGTLDTNFNPQLATYIVRRVIAQPDGRIIVAADTSLAAGNLILGRLLGDGRPDPNFKPQLMPPPDGGVASGPVYAYDLALQPDGKILFASSVGLQRFLIHGALDIGFAPPTNNFLQAVYAIDLLADGRILVGGSRQDTNSHSLVRLNPDGTRDATFNAEPIGIAARSIATQPDGRVIVVGSSDSVGTAPNTQLGRLNADGSLDSSFESTYLGSSLSASVTEVLLKPNGKIILIGGFSSFDSYDRPGVVQLHSDPPTPPRIVRQPAALGVLAGQTARFSALVSCVPEPGFHWQKDGVPVSGATTQWLFILNTHAPDAGQYTLVVSNALGVVTSAPAALVVGPAPTYAGGVDASFYSGAGPNDSVYAAIEQPDGKIVIGGLFTSVNGVARNRIARLNADGSLDATFDPGVAFGGTSVFPSVQALALQLDGKILAAGFFATFNGAAANSIARLNTDGSLDTSFTTNGLPYGANVYTLVRQPDGKVLCGLDMGHRLERLNPNGVRDASFMTGGLGFTAGQVRAIALQADGKIIVGGSALVWGGSPKPSLLRFATN
ncbi:MAG TPA: immunoglobulin domain-containing protein, partial [Candidatus Binatia bacterium]|nr:immunoglobulin domain-containing protein [Candidatus Binatia bacterium]